MKKLYSLIFISTFSLFTINVNAAVFNVAVADFSFTPGTLTGVVVGDEIIFTLVSGTHNVTSPASGVPAGAAPISSGILTSTPYSYTVTVAGNYGYQCTIHPTTMFGGFIASAVGIADPAVNYLTSVYPSPFSDKVTVKYNGIESIEFVNVVGGKIKTVEMPSAEGKLEVDLVNLPAGIYFYRTYKEGVVSETRKIVKAK